MKNIIFSVIIISYSVFMVACAGRTAGKATEHRHTHTEEHSHEEHDHAGHDHSHEGHDHTEHNHSHEGHNHEEHEGHDHSEHDHSHEEHSHEGCNHEGHNHGEAGVEHGAGDEIIFPAAQAARVGLSTAETALSTFHSVIRASGDLSAAQGDAVTVVAPIGGVVSLGGGTTAQGKSIAKGEVLFYVSSRNIVGGDEAAKAKASYEAAKAAWERAEALLPDKIISQKEYDAARLEYLNAKSAWEALAAESSDRGSAVRAPSAGYISSVAVTEGQFVEVGQPLATVSRNARMRLTARVPQRYYAHLTDVRSANIVAPDGRVVELSNLDGRLVAVGRSLTEGSTTVSVTFEFTADPWLIVGSTVEVYLLGTPHEGVLTLPVGALTESQGLYFVYQKVDDEGYIKHEVTVGESDGERVEITGGITPGMEIVTRGAVHVKMATNSAIPHSHQH
jgi:RND family efflux transporter MFP subunit